MLLDSMYCDIVRIIYNYEKGIHISELDKISYEDEVYMLDIPELMSLDKEKVNNAIKNCKTHEGYW